VSSMLQLKSLSSSFENTAKPFVDIVLSRIQSERR
jgi:hypothetical protein